LDQGIEPSIREIAHDLTGNQMFLLDPAEATASLEEHGPEGVFKGPAAEGAVDDGYLGSLNPVSPEGSDAEEVTG